MLAFPPTKFNRNIFLFYLLSALYNAWFVEAIWYFYWARFASYTTIALMFVILTIVWVAAEIPTGVFADRFGRKLSVTIGFLSLTIGSFAVALASSSIALFIGGFAENIGRAFISGSLESLVYDDLKTQHREEEFAHTMSVKSQIETAVYAVAVPIGGFLYARYFRLPNMLMVVSLGFAFITSFFLKEIRSTKPIATGVSIRELAAGFHELKTEKLRPYVPLIFLFVSLSFLFNWGLSKPAIAVHFGYGPRGQSILYAIMSIGAIMAVRQIPRIRRFVSYFGGLVLFSLIVIAGYLCGALPIGAIGALPLIFMELTTTVAEPWISTMVNHAIPSAYRATTLSTIQFVAKIPFIAITIFLGSSLDRGQATIFHGSLAIVSIILLAITIWYAKINQPKLSTNN